MKHLGFVFILWTIQAVAGEASLDLNRLKDNMRMSEENRRQLSSASSTAKENMTRYGEAVKQLNEMKTAVEKNSLVASDNQKSLQAGFGKLDDFISQENRDIEAEKKYITELKKKIQQAEARQLQRQKNIALYEEKKKEIIAEKESWQLQKENVKSIVAVIDGKKKTAEEGLVRWQKEYQELSGKEKNWNARAASSKEVYEKVKTFKERNQVR